MVSFWAFYNPEKLLMFHNQFYSPGKGVCFIYRTIYHEGILGLMRDFWLPSAAATQVSEWINCVYQDLKILNPAVGCLSVVVDYVRSPWVECLSPCLQQKKLGCWKSVLMKVFQSKHRFLFLERCFSVLEKMKLEM